MLFGATVYIGIGSSFFAGSVVLADGKAGLEHRGGGDALW